jgi:hypothetical protein
MTRRRLLLVVSIENRMRQIPLVAPGNDVDALPHYVVISHPCGRLIHLAKIVTKIAVRKESLTFGSGYDVYMASSFPRGNGVGVGPRSDVKYTTEAPPQ